MTEFQTQSRCYHCFRPRAQCYCAALPSIENRTQLLILQHVGERSHPFNTARMVQRALKSSQLIAGHNLDFSKMKLPIQPAAGLLYPGANARLLEELSPQQRPKQLVMIDGTWHQAKTIVRDVPLLQTLPCYRLSPAAPGQYRIRREPNAFSLSTVEAVVAAFELLEPETAGWRQLLRAFQQMVENQLLLSAGQASWRKRKSRGARPRNIPAAILENPSRLVVAYGEAAPGKNIHQRLPVNWAAQRLGGEETFTCRLRQPDPLPDSALQHMRISAEDDEAISPVQFRKKWNDFLCSGDILVVYHQRTCQLLKNIEAQVPRCLVLKSIFKTRRHDFRSLEELLAAEGVFMASTFHECRALERMKMAAALVEHLRETSTEYV